jgi:hypothetical protein
VSTTSAELESTASDCFIHSRYKDLFSLDSHGRFAQAYGAKFDLGKVWRQRNLCTVNADQMIHRMLDNPTEAFDAICEDQEVQEWIMKQKQPCQIYFVTGIKELKNARFKKAQLGDGGISKRLLETPLAGDARVPRSVKVKDVGGAGSPNGKETVLNGVFGLAVSSVKARVNNIEEPHEPGDVGYLWSYKRIEVDGAVKQLMIGLGPPVPAEVLKDMLDPSEDDVAIDLSALSAMSESALTATHSPMLMAHSPAFRGRSPSPNPSALRI